MNVITMTGKSKVGTTSSKSWLCRYEGGIHSNRYHEHELRIGRGQHLLQGTLELNAAQYLLLCRDSQTPQYSMRNPWGIVYLFLDVLFHTSPFATEGGIGPPGELKAAPRGKRKCQGRPAKAYPVCPTKQIFVRRAIR
jgi:hypothetical protein